MSANWTQIENTELTLKAYDMLRDNATLGCAYHNFLHVDSMYRYLADTEKPYDEALDWAILFHDIVYDARPDKEFRSAEMFLDMVDKYAGCTLDALERSRVCKLIMDTVDHVVIPNREGSSAIIRADLHGLTNRLATFQNYGRLLDEAHALYGFDELTFALNSEVFMAGLKDRVIANMKLDSQHAGFYHTVVWVGISLTNQLSQALKSV